MKLKGSLRSGVVHSLSRVQLYNPKDCSTPGLPILHHLPEPSQIHVHWVGDVFQQSHPLSSPSPPAFNLSQNQGFSSESAIRIRWPKCWSFSFSISPSMNIQDWFPSGLTGLIYLQSKGLSGVFSNTTVQKHQFCGAQPSLWYNSHIHTFTHNFDYMDLCQQRNVSAFQYTV